MRDLVLGKCLGGASLLVLFGAAWFTAGAFNDLAAMFVRPEPNALFLEGPGSPRPSRPASADPALWRLVGLDPSFGAREGGADEPRRERNCEDPLAVPVRSGLPLNFVGAALGEGPGAFVATIEDASRQSRTVTSGDEIGGAEVLGLERLAAEDDLTGNGFRVVAVLCNGGTREYIELSSKVAPGAASPGRPQPANAAGLESVRALGEERYEIDRSVLEGALSDPRQLATLRAVPAIENGAVAGFRVSSIQPGSLASALGIQDGDLLRLVNGYRLDSMDKALELLQRLRTSGRVTLELQRGNAAIRKDVRITGGG